MKNRIEKKSNSSSVKTKPKECYLETTLSKAEHAEFVACAKERGISVEDALVEAVEEHLVKRRETREQITWRVGLSTWDGDTGEYIGDGELSTEDLIKLLHEAANYEKPIGDFITEIIRAAVSYQPGQQIRELVFQEKVKAVAA